MKATSILSQINDLTESQLIDLNNTYSESINTHDSYVYYNDEDFFSTFYPNTGDGLRVAQAIFYGDYNYSHNYVKFNGYGNLESIAYFKIDNLCELPQVMEDYIEDNFSEFEHLFESNTEED